MVASWLVGARTSKGRGGADLTNEWLEHLAYAGPSVPPLLLFLLLFLLLLLMLV